MDVLITQTAAWRKLQSDLGETSFFEQQSDYQYLAILKKTPTGNYLYCPYGPSLRNADALPAALKALKALARRQSAIFIRIEPSLALEDEYLRHTADSLDLTTRKSRDLNPKETWLLDLTGSDADLQERLPSRLLRYYKSAAKKGITIETSHDPRDIHQLLALQQTLAREKGINTFSEHYLATELQQPFATLYLVKYRTPVPSHDSAQVTTDDIIAAPNIDESTVVAAGLVFDDATTRYNLQGAQSDLGRSLHATGILTLQLIFDARAAGKRLFDFWGIAPDNAPADHPWSGFTKFKKTFAGYEAVHTGTYDLILSPTRYRFYRLARQINRQARR